MRALKRLSHIFYILIMFSGMLWAQSAVAGKIILASTTSLDNSGLYDYLLPYFRNETGIDISIIAVGTGRAIAIAKRGDADVLIVHDRKSELDFVNQGYGIECTNFMYNRYLIVGPHQNPAAINRDMNIKNVMKLIAESQSLFISRSDDSGTHKKEIGLWNKAGITPFDQSDWYHEVGRGMSIVLNMANEKLGYTLTDYATWLSFRMRENLTVLYDNEKYMYNPYSIIRINPKRYPNVNHTDAKIFAEWIRSDRALKLIESFKLNNHQLFFPLFNDQQKRCS